jgi:hypothetical protein
VTGSWFSCGGKRRNNERKSLSAVLCCAVVTQKINKCWDFNNGKKGYWLVDGEINKNCTRGVMYEELESYVSDMLLWFVIF